MSNIIEARVKQKKDTLPNWEANPMILLDGEQAFVVSDSGQPINFKIGDGTKSFSELPYWIDYAGGQYIEISGNALPTPTVDVGYTFVGPGTYTFAGQPDIIAPDGRFSQLVWDESAWSLKDMGELPTQPLTNVIDQSTDKAVTPKGVDDALINQRQEIDNELSPLFDVFTSPNLFDRDVYLFSDRLVTSASDDGIRTASGWNVAIIPLPDSGNYTIQGWDSVRNEIGFFSGTAPTTLPASYTTGIIKSGDSGYVLSKYKSSGILTFTKPTEATWMALTVANGTEADSVFAQLQVVKGNQALPYYPYGEIKQLKPQFTSVQSKIKEIKKVAGTVFIRTKFSEALDLVRSISLYGSQNGASNLSNVNLISSGADIQDAGSRIHSMADSVPTPLQANVSSQSTYLNIGGNHGVKSVADILSSGHGKTSSDLLSIWSDSNGDQFYLTNIIDANNIRVIPVPKTVGGYDKVKETPISPLTHVSGASNTSSITFTGSAYEWKPAIRDISVSVFVDDDEIIQDGTYFGDVVKIVDTHTIVDPTQPNLVNPYNATNNGAIVKNTLIHFFYSNGSYTVEQIVDSQKNHVYTNIGTIQPQPISRGTNTGFKVFSPNIGVKSGFNFDTGVDFSSSFAGVDIFSTDLKDSTKKTNAISQVIYNGSNPVYAGAFGYNIEVGSPKTPSNSRIYLSNAKKYYPRGFTGASGTNIIRIVGFFAYWNASLNPDLSHNYFYYYGGYKYYHIMIINSMVKKQVALEKDLLGRKFTTVEKSTGMVIHTEDFTTSEGIVVSGAIGDWAVLRVE